MAVPNDHYLTNVRRVDWRFLLPSPVLKNVAYLPGQNANPELLDSLRLVCDDLTVVEPGGPSSARPAAFDLVVAERVQLDVVRQAAAWVRASGSFYAEFDGRWGLASRAARVLREAGFADVTTCWHWPNFQEATRILPLNRPEALAHAILKDRRGTQAAAIGRGVSLLQRVGAFAWLLEHTSVIGQRPA